MGPHDTRSAVSKRVLADPVVFVNGQDMSDHCLRVVVDHTPGNMCVAAITLYVSKITLEDGQITYYFGDVPDGV